MQWYLRMMHLRVAMPLLIPFLTAGMIGGNVYLATFCLICLVCLWLVDRSQVAIEISNHAGELSSEVISLDFGVGLKL